MIRLLKQEIELLIEIIDTAIKGGLWEKNSKRLLEIKRKHSY